MFILLTFHLFSLIIYPSNLQDTHIRRGVYMKKLHNANEEIKVKQGGLNALFTWKVFTQKSVNCRLVNYRRKHPQKPI